MIDIETVLNNLWDMADGVRKRAMALGMAVPIAVAAMAGPAPPARAAGDPTGGAARVASRLGVALWSFDWTVSPATATSQLRPWVTASLWAELEASPGAPSAQAARVDDHEVDRVTSVSAVVADISAHGVGVAVSAAVTVFAGGKYVGVGRNDAEMLVVRAGPRWRVSEIDL
jgi:hypothetical protein